MNTSRGKTVRIINTPSETVRKSFFYVQEAGYINAPDSTATERENLSSFLIVLVLSGSGVLEYDGRSYTLKEGNAFFIDCTKKHLYKADEKNPWEILWVHFNGATSREYFDYFYSRSAAVFVPENSFSMENSLRNIIEINEAAAANSAVRSSLLIVSLLTGILESVAFSREPVPETAKALKRYLSGSFTRKITLEQLSEQFGLSKYHLEREFKKCCGITIFDYITAKRITLAKRLLRFTDKSIDEISAACGFSDQSYFNRQFKKSEGMTGSAFRKMWRN
ncbi:MAG: helix-turn-helix domain-containing protein [Ruminococcus sp.]|nr:helix-turn-helix domain-containing protein [Ruminococcus sp.]